MDLNHLLKGAYDMHIHTAPDVTPRKCDDLELARRLQAAGMAGCAIKSHYMDTSGRAALLQKLYPELTFAGGVTLNRSVGGRQPPGRGAYGPDGRENALVPHPGGPRLSALPPRR